jgi:Multidrug resistance efflux pump
MKKSIGLFVVLVLILIFAVFAIRWIEHRMKYVISDAVFVETDYLSNVGFNRVSGKIIQLYKKEGDLVKSDETIAKIDDTDYKIQLENINYEIESLKKQKSQLENHLSRIIQENELNQKITSLTTQEIEKKIESLIAQKSQVEAQIEKAKKDEERYRNLLEKGLVPKAKYEEINTQLKVLLDQRKAIEKSISELNVSKTKSKESLELVRTQGQVSKEIQDQISALEDKILALTKQKEDLENLIKYTELKSPYNGIIAKKYVSIGDIVKAGQPIYAIVKENSFYIKVLLEETKLSGVKVGNKAYIKLDAYPDKTFEGEVESIDIASAAKFALVPRDISAGEFTKLAQRIPVKIRITKGDMSLLRVGLGGEVEIEKK